VKLRPTFGALQTNETDAPAARASIVRLQFGDAGSTTDTASSSTSPGFATVTVKVAVPKSSAGARVPVFASSLSTTLVWTLWIVGVLVIERAGAEAAASELAATAAPTRSDPMRRALPLTGRT
jgi:hypothetical protein